ncbi:MAG: hypothetical protein RL619_1886 [Bacteroidota bacterium]
MEGLEAVENNLSYISSINRFDAEFFNKKFINQDTKLKLLPHIKISEFADVTDGEHGSPELDENSGIVYLSGHNIKDNLIDLDNIRYCSLNLHNKNLRSSLKIGNVLISIVGTVGKSSVVYTNIVANTDRNIATIKNINNKINPYYLSTFINSNFGIFQTKRFSAGNVQPLLNLIQVKSIVVPLLSQQFQQKIENLVTTAHSYLEQSQTLYKQAEQILLTELDLENFKSSKNNIAIKSIKNSFLDSGRLDAEYYQEKYEQLEEHIKNYKGGFAKIEDFIDDYSTGYPFDSDTYSENGDIDLIRITNIKNGYLDLSNTNKVPLLKDNAIYRNIVKENDLLISMSGTIGNCCKIEKNIHAIINQRILKLSIKDYEQDTLCLIINSIICKMQLEKIGTGGVQTNISPKDIFNIVIPILPLETQTQISSKIQQSFLLKTKSQKLLNIAKLAVEIAIEQSEEKALQYITEQEKLL